MIKGVYGLNIAVSDLDAAIQKFEGLLQMKATKIMGQADFAIPGLKGAAFDVGGFVIHLIQSVAENTSISKFIQKKGEGLFLLSLRSDNVDEDMNIMKQAGAEFLTEEPMRGNFGSVNFVHPRSANGVQIEVYNPEK